MRAKTIFTLKSKAYIFDFDDTLVQTDAKIHIYKNGKYDRSLTPEEYNFYIPKPGEEKDVSDFIDPRLILNATKYKMWPALENIYNAKKMGRSNSEIYILTARSSKAQLPIQTFFIRNNIKLDLDHIITVGTDDGKKINIPKNKEIVLRELVKEYDEVFFFDDSEQNIHLANKIPGVKTRLIDWNK